MISEQAFLKLTADRQLWQIIEAIRGVSDAAPFMTEQGFLRLNPDRKMYQVLQAIESISETSGSSSQTFLPEVVGFLGGGATKLDGIISTDWSMPHWFEFDHPDLGRKWYKLRAGTDAEDSTDYTIVHPADYDAVHNQRVLELRG